MRGVLREILGSMGILVTGAGGFLGGVVAARLAARGDRVIALGRSVASLAAAQRVGCETVVADLRDRAAVSLLASLGPLDAVVHCAGLSSNWDTRSAFAANNISATGNLLGMCPAFGMPHVVFVSSSSVYFAFRDQLGVHEAHPLPQPVNDYAWSKREAEALVHAAPNTSIIRPRGIFGTGDTALLSRLLRAARRGPLPLFRDGRAVIDLTHVDDVTAALMAVLDARAATVGNIYNVSGGEPVRVVEIIEQAAARSGLSVRWKAMPWLLAKAGLGALEAYHRAFRPEVEPIATRYSAGLLAFSQTLDISAIARDTGWRPAISFSQGLDRTFGGPNS